VIFIFYLLVILWSIGLIFILRVARSGREQEEKQSKRAEYSEYSHANLVIVNFTPLLAGYLGCPENNVGCFGRCGNTGFPVSTALPSLISVKLSGTGRARATP